MEIFLKKQSARLLELVVICPARSRTILIDSSPVLLDLPRHQFVALIVPYQPPHKHLLVGLQFLCYDNQNQLYAPAMPNLISMQGHVCSRFLRESSLTELVTKAIDEFWQTRFTDHPTDILQNLGYMLPEELTPFNENEVSS